MAHGGRKKSHPILRPTFITQSSKVVHGVNIYFELGTLENCSNVHHRKQKIAVRVEHGFALGPSRPLHRCLHGATFASSNPIIFSFLSSQILYGFTLASSIPSWLRDRSGLRHPTWRISHMTFRSFEHRCDEVCFFSFRLEFGQVGVGECGEQDEFLT